MTLAAVAISGGIDSLVSAYLLKAAGHEVVGLHFLTGFEDSPAPQEDARHPIHGLGAQLGVPIQILDLSTPFRRTVVDYFSTSYQAGRTPNPCLFCNPIIKFGHLWSYASRLGADFLATGHYARIARDPAGDCRLLRGVDRHKDQSYFLARLSPAQLERARFPLGDRRKEDVRRLAAAKGLKPLAPGESQDVCFIRQTTYSRFLADYSGVPAAPGPIVDTGGRVIGQHQGLHRFTIGQRRGIDCPAAQPYYVVGIQPDANRLVVGFKDELGRMECEVTEINWIRRPTRFPAEAQVKIRYRHRAARARLTPAGTDKTVHVRFAEPQEAITPGQGAVFYDGEEVRGGGWIV